MLRNRNRYRTVGTSPADPESIRSVGPDLDPNRIRNPDPDPGGQKLATKVEKIKKFHVLKCWMLSFEI
jgi:hypothetical protein